MFGRKKAPKEEVLWTGANSLLTNPLKRTLKPEFYKITNFRILKSNSRIFRLGANTESLELYRVTDIRVDQGLYQKFIGLGAGDVVIIAEQKEMVWRSVPHCKKVESRIWAAVSEAKKTIIVSPKP